ncbi:hypothetical protein [Curtobacterium sp. NPDC089689]|uniref:hypothetical protein n=1 Tax=Curtobacterium sp. NPDC089689 TaxID=3363968 RepID=UPI00381A17E4
MLLAIPLNAVDELDEPDALDEFDRQALALALADALALTEALGSGHEPDDTIIVPVAGDRVRYSRGTGDLVGLEGSVVTADDAPDLPLGLRCVLLDDEPWPVVVPVTSLDRV